MTKSVTDVDDRDFEQALRTSEKPILLEFYLANCPHCRRLEPILETAAQNFGARAQFLRLDARANTTRPQYGLSGTPTLVVYREGEEIVTKTGAMREQQLHAFLRNYV